MAKQADSAGEDPTTNRSANREKAEGSRDQVGTASEPGGISNRGPAEAEKEQDVPRGDAAAQEQAIDRSPDGRSRPGPSVDDERTASSNTQHAGGLTGGSPGGGPTRTPERARTEQTRPFVAGADPADEDRNPPDPSAPRTKHPGSSGGR